MTPNIEQAKDDLFDATGFSEYSRAYIVTNEELRYALKYVNKKTKNALTVAASGDHPLFIKLYGAKNVDTFDISYNAKVIMDIKTNALSLLNQKEYCKLLADLSRKEIKFINDMPKIINKLPKVEQKYIHKLNDYWMFGREICYDDSPALPTKKEFANMRKAINKPFRFIWSDIRNLDEKLTKKYDFIHLSNIFDYLLSVDIKSILYKLTQHTNPGCTICIVGYHKKNMLYVCDDVTNKHLQNNTGQVWKCSKGLDTYFMHRVR